MLLSPIRSGGDADHHRAHLARMRHLIDIYREDLAEVRQPLTPAQRVDLLGRVDRLTSSAAVLQSALTEWDACAAL